MIDHRLDAGLVGDVGPNEAHGRATFCLQCLPFSLAATGGNNERTLGGEHFRDAFADATSRTCYDSDFVAKSAHLLLPPRLSALVLPLFGSHYIA
jgi:hypothetical protein